MTTFSPLSSPPFCSLDRCTRFYLPPDVADGKLAPSVEPRHSWRRMLFFSPNWLFFGEEDDPQPFSIPVDFYPVELFVVPACKQIVASLAPFPLPP